MKTSRRLFQKRKFFLLIILSCLTVGFSAFLSLYNFISFEYSYDRFHDKKDRIYRVQLERSYPDRVDLSAGVTAGVAPLLTESFSEIGGYVKLWGTRHLRNILQKDELSVEAEQLYFATKDFFTVFSFPMVKGDPGTALSRPNTAIITQRLARKIFGDDDPLGKTIIYHNPWESTNIEITGITWDPPVNSHLKYDMLVSFETLARFNSGARDSFGWNAFNTYILMNNNRLPDHFQDRIDNFIATNYAPLIERGVDVNLYFQPITEIHLGPEMRFQPEPGGDKEVLNTLTLAAVFIILLAWLNYINLSTANVSDRAKEVGIRKVSGATKKDLIAQFLFEAFLLNLVAMIISLMIVELSHNQLVALIGKEIPGNLYLRPDIWIIAGILVGGGMLLSGIYPAVALASFKPSVVLKGVKTGSRFFGLRRGLVVFQLTVSFILISGTLVIFNQIKFMQKTNLGVNLEEVLVVKGPGLVDSTWSQKLAYFKQNVSSFSGIHNVANTTSVPGLEITWVNNSVRWLGNPDETNFSLPFTGISAEYLDLMNLEIIAGRTFMAGTEQENTTVVLTSSASKLLGFRTPEDAIGERIMDSNVEYTVVGVCADYHQQSLNKKISPVVFRYVADANSYFVFKINTSNLEETIAMLNTQWTATLPGNPFEFFFLDEFFDGQYTSDQRFVNIFGIFTGIGVFIGALGLLALSWFMIKRRESEVSIRKVLGASDFNIIGLFTSEIMGILALAILFGAPTAWYLSELLLQNYPYKTSFQWSWLLYPVFTLVTVLIVTSAWRIIQVSRRNPVNAIREQ